MEEICILIYAHVGKHAACLCSPTSLGEASSDNKPAPKLRQLAFKNGWAEYVEEGNQGGRSPWWCCHTAGTATACTSSPCEYSMPSMS